MTKKVWKEYLFTDGYREICYGMSKNELAWAEYKHGKLVSIRVL